jgi:hypothetical protein
VKKLGVGILAVLVLLLASAVPSDAWARGHGGWHGGGHRGCCWGGWWWPGAIVGSLALGAATYPYYYAPPTVVYPQAQVYVASPAPPIQREVVYQNGKYVLYGDGVTQPWQWVWVPAAPAVPPPPPPPR